MKTNLLRAKLLIIVLFILYTISGYAQAPTTSLTNDDRYNIEVQFTQGCGVIGSDGANNTPEQNWISRADSVYGSSGRQLFSKTNGANNNPKFCYQESTFNDVCHYTTAGRMGLIEDTPSSGFDWEVMSWEDDGTQCTYNIYPDGTSGNSDDNMSFYAGRLTISTNLFTGWRSWGPSQDPSITFSNGSSFRARYAKILHNGRSITNPLIFKNNTDQLRFTQQHNYVIMASPSGADAKMGHVNALQSGAFTAGREVYYSLEVSGPRNILISVGGSTKVHLIKYTSTPSAGTYEYLTTGTTDSFGFQEINTNILCKGHYGVVVEGASANDLPTYSLSVRTTAITPSYSAGTIAAPTSPNNPDNYYPYPLETEGTIGTISSSDNGTFPASPQVQYSWEKKVGSTWTKIDQTNTASYAVPELATTTTYRRNISLLGCSSPDDIQATSNVITFNIIQPDGIINGRVVPPNAAFNGERGVSGVIVKAVRTTAVINGVSNKTYTDTTDSDGYYTIDNIYYGSTTSGGQATFTVTPSKGEHIFAPVSTNKTLTSNSPTTDAQPANFVDLTVFTISGTTFQLCTDCDGATPSSPIYAAMDSVSFEVNRTTSPTGVVPVTSQSSANGVYSLDVDQQGTYRVKPTYKKSGYPDHTFVTKGGMTNSDSLVAIGEALDTPNVDFVNTTTHTISGYVRAGCGQYVGQAQIKFQQILGVDEQGTVTFGNQLIKTVTTNLNSGFYSVTLPAARYKATIVGFATVASGFNGNEMVEFFGVNKFFPLDSVSRDITWEDATLNFTFHEFPEIVVEYDAACNDLAAFPLFYQNKYKKFTIKAYEGSPSKVIAGQATLGCLMADNDTILTAETNVHYKTETGNKTFDFIIENGVHLDSLKGGHPNITEPFTKVLTIKLKDPYSSVSRKNNYGEVATKILTPIVIGNLPSAATFNTVSPEIPLLILRDPPGDMSYSFFEENQTTEIANRFFAADGENKGFWDEVRVGGKFTAFGIETEAWGAVGASFDVSNTSTSTEEAILSISNTTEYNTSNNTIDDGLSGGSGDLYIGAAVNMLYAVVRETIFNESDCRVEFKKSLMLGGNGFATHYMYTEGYILNNVIPDLERTIASGNNTLAQEEDLRSQISVWQQTVNRNKELKANAIFDKNLSFNATGNPTKFSTTSSSSQSSTIEFSMAIEEGVAAEVGLEVGGVGGSAGGYVNFKMESGSAETVTQLNSTTTGFYLGDDDAGDAFTVDVKKDPVYNTPVFDLIAGKSSCPFEFGTQPRDEFSFTTTNSELSGIPAGTQADFIVNIANTSQTDEGRAYNIQYTNSTTGALVNVGGATGGDALKIPLERPTEDDNRDVLVTVTQGSPSYKVFTPITLRAFDNCPIGKGNLEKFLQLKAIFAGACSNIRLQSPENGQVVSAASNNRLNLDIRDYTSANIVEVSLQSKSDTSSVWRDRVTWTSLANNAAGDGSKFWEIPTTLPDGNYKVRMQLKCATDIVYSNEVDIIIDRTPPVPFGLPEPTDRVLVLGDQISATYNDLLGCGSLSSNNYSITRLSNNQPIPAAIGCYQNKVFITPTVDILGWVGDSVRVNLTNIPDKYGNIQTTPNEWKFNIGTATAAPPSLPIATVSTSSPNAIREDASGFVNITFTLSQTSSQNTTINFLVAGDAQYGADFTGVDARTALGFESNLQTGQIIIPANTLSASTKLYPVNDTDFEADETVFISIISGGNYTIGLTNNVTITILKDDDTDDCLNGGLPFTLTNNDGGSTALANGTYHKLILESTAKVRTATTVVLKGEKSITLKPGFEIENGSIFSAVMEDCPEGTTTATAALVSNSKETFALPISLGVYPENNSSKILAVQDVDKDGNIKIKFENPRNQQYLIRLNSFRAAMVQNLTTNQVYKAGTNEVTLNVAELNPGIYFLKIKGLSDDQTTYHRIVIAD